MARPRVSEPGLTMRLAIGAIAGAAATMAFAAAAKRFQPGAGSFRPGPGTLAYGALAGAMLIAFRPDPGRAAGLLAGGGLWLAGEAGLLPSFTLRPARGPAPGSAARLAGHLAWGWSVTAAVRDAETLRAALASRLD